MEYGILVLANVPRYLLFCEFFILTINSIHFSSLLLYCCPVACVANFSIIYRLALLANARFLKCNDSKSDKIKKKKTISMDVLVNLIVSPHSTSICRPYCIVTAQSTHKNHSQKHNNNNLRTEYKSLERTPPEQFTVVSKSFHDEHFCCVFYSPIRWTEMLFSVKDETLLLLCRRRK